MTMYHFINDESFPEVCYSSTDKELLEEIMCDEFMLDVMYEFNAQLEIGFSVFKTVNEIADYAWDTVLEYYNDYVDIVKSEVI